MRSGYFVQTSRNFFDIETAAKHFRCKKSDTFGDRSGRKNFENRFAVVIDGYVKIRAVKWNAPRRTLKFTRTSRSDRSIFFDGFVFFIMSDSFLRYT